MSESTKVCRRCNRVKPLTDFYRRSHIDSYISECIQCMKERSKTRVRPPRGKTLVDSEQMVIDKLRSIGIFATTGKLSVFADSDIVAWGCIPIEVKFAALRWNKSKQRFMFTTTPAQRARGFIASVVILVCEYPEGRYTFHVFEPDFPAFYREGRLKVGFTFTPGQEQQIKHQQYYQMLTQHDMDVHENRWELIEQKRLTWQKYIDT